MCVYRYQYLSESLTRQTRVGSDFAHLEQFSWSMPNLSPWSFPNRTRSLIQPFEGHIPSRNLFLKLSRRRKLFELESLCPISQHFQLFPLLFQSLLLPLEFAIPSNRIGIKDVDFGREITIIRIVQTIVNELPHQHFAPLRRFLVAL